MNSNMAEHFNKLLYAHKEIKRVGKMQDYGFVLSGPEFGLLVAINEFALEISKDKNPVGVGVAMKKLSDNRNCTPAMITKVVTALENKGYAKRFSSSEDRRGVKVCITEKGYDIFKQDEKAHEKLIEEIAEKMGEDKMIALINLINEFMTAGKEVISERQKNNSKGEN